jgi:hypothetical protein
MALIPSRAMLNSQHMRGLTIVQTLLDLRRSLAYNRNKNRRAVFLLPPSCLPVQHMMTSGLEIPKTLHASKLKVAMRRLLPHLFHLR